MSVMAYSEPGRKKSNVGLIVGIVVAVLFLCCGFLGFAGYTGFKSVTKMAGKMFQCGNTMADYRDAMVAYSKKHDGKLPPAKNWMEDIKPYLKSTKIPGILASEPVGEGVCDATLPSAICYNSDVAGKSISSFDPSSEIPLLFETPSSGKDLSQKYTEEPFISSPKMLGQPRGWIVQPVYGSGYMIGQNGKRTPVTRMSGSASVQVTQSPGTN
jgi:hypothetical protein